MARIDNGFIFRSFIVVSFITLTIGLIIGIFNTLTSLENRKTKLAELKFKSDSYVELTSGKYTYIYYTTKSTIQVTEQGTCISFTDNSTNTPMSACTQFIVKAY